MCLSGASSKPRDKNHESKNPFGLFHPGDCFGFPPDSNPNSTAIDTNASRADGNHAAATIFADQTSIAETEHAEKATLTVAVPSPTNTPVTTSTPNAFQFRLPANACWMNSEIAIRAGQSVVIRASGEINTWGGREGSSGNPNGQTAICGAIQYPLHGVSYGALIGRLEDLPPFFVGTTLRFTATKDVQLYFTVNDWECGDNSGDFNILFTFP